ncbi:hypothetical protein [Hymenobacter sp. 102]|uniref:hypothetical protein n=1 Tax=Hymenobacter sp. 102 TaxID=3403152 RepID=UPI003CF59CDA
MTRNTFVVLACLLAAAPAAQAQVPTTSEADHGHPHPSPSEGAKPAAPSLPTVSYTLFTTKSELYAESKPLIAGAPNRFTAHLTKLGTTFKPYTAGQVTVSLQVGGNTVKASADAPAAPGIFRFQLPPAPAGTGTLVIDIVTPEFTDQFTIPNVMVYANAEAARQQPKNEEAGDITYIKEKSWVLADFATQLLTKGSVGSGKKATTGLVVPRGVGRRQGQAARLRAAHGRAVSAAVGEDRRDERATGTVAQRRPGG